MTPQRLREIADRWLPLAPPSLLDELRAHASQLECNAHALQSVTDSWRDDVARLEAQLERNAEWRDISTAPNTKDEVLIFEHPGNIRVATRIPDTNTYLDGTTYGIYDEPCEFFPTHWMPLPKPPEAK